MIPARRLKHVAHVRTSNVDKKTVATDRTVRLANYLDVYAHAHITDDLDFMVATATDDQIRRLSLAAGDVLFTKDSETPDDIAVPAYVPRPLEDVVCGYHLAIATPLPTVADGHFLYWALQAQPVADQFRIGATGVTRFGLRQSTIGQVEIPTPPLAQQRGMAQYLEDTCGQIDAALAECVGHLNLVNERDRATIWGLVTGQSEGGPRSNSGPWWLASTPQRWTPQKVARNFKTGSGTTPSSGEARFYGGPHPWLNTGECRDDVVLETNRSVTDAALAEHSALKFYPEGSVVVAMYGATIGRLAILGRSMTVNQACAVLYEPTGLDPWFTFWWLWAHRSELVEMGEGGGQPNINQQLIRQLVIPAPPLDEQIRIAGEISNLRAKSQELRESVEEQARLLMEKRTALITAVVTGQVEVNR